jgi:hypothetical protein
LAARVDKMLAAGRITAEEADRVRAASSAGDDVERVVGEIRRRHATEWVAAAVEQDRLSEHEATEVLASVERGDGPGDIRRLRQRRRAE